MGLDMYLYAKRYLSDYSPDDKKIKDAIADQLADPFKNLKEIKVEVAYWRKANQIHKWFVDNVQNGVDECQECNVSIQQIQKLVDTCNEVIEDPSKAETLMPTGSGFFFGSTKYDDHYFEDLRSTVQLLKPLLQDQVVNVLKDEINLWTFCYQSSW
jgi:hypothetical protein